MSQDLIAEIRPRKQSIEVIKEEMEDLTDNRLDSSLALSGENNAEFNSENNDNVDEENELKLDGKTGNDSDNKAFIYGSEDQLRRNDSKLDDDLLEAIKGDETTFMEEECFIMMKQGLIFLDNGINDV